MRRLLFVVAVCLVVASSAVAAAAPPSYVLDDEDGGARCLWNDYAYISCGIWHCWWVGQWEWPDGRRCA